VNVFLFEFCRVVESEEGAGGAIDDTPEGGPYFDTAIFLEGMAGATLGGDFFAGGYVYIFEEGCEVDGAFYGGCGYFFCCFLLCFCFFARVGEGHLVGRGRIEFIADGASEGQNKQTEEDTAKDFNFEERVLGHKKAPIKTRYVFMCGCKVLIRSMP